jgi:pyruvate formate lyase activating enzyme
MFAAMDAANVDLKGFSEQFYQRFCGATLADVLSTLVYIREQTDLWLEVTTLLIPGENDSEAELHDMTRWVANNLGPETPLHFTAFHPDYKMLDKPPTPPLTLLRARDLAKANGLRFVYTGNIRHPESQQTFCPSCGHLLIGRDGFDVTHYALTEQGTCPSCGHSCAGVFGTGHGRWGGRRLPVRMDSG